MINEIWIVFVKGLPIDTVFENKEDADQFVVDDRNYYGDADIYEVVKYVRA